MSNESIPASESSRFSNGRRGSGRGLHAERLASCWDYHAAGEQHSSSDGNVGGNFGSTFHGTWTQTARLRPYVICGRSVERSGTCLRACQAVQELPRIPEAPGIGCGGNFHTRTAACMDATEAMKAGKHVISAVPAGMSVEELELLLETVEKTGLKYMMAETSYYRPEVITCREWAGRESSEQCSIRKRNTTTKARFRCCTMLRGFPTWRYGFPPMHYPTHCTGIVIPITGERLVEVEAVGWGDGHEVLATNEYKNPFWDTTAFFRRRRSLFKDFCVLACGCG